MGWATLLFLWLFKIGSKVSVALLGQRCNSCFIRKAGATVGVLCHGFGQLFCCCWRFRICSQDLVSAALFVQQRCFSCVRKTLRHSG